MSGPVRYRVSMLRPHSHLYEVEATFPAEGDELIVALPVWTPGSYLVREFSRHVQRFRAFDAQGSEIAAERFDKRSFRVGVAEGFAICRYEVYANELTVRTSHLDGTHGFFNPATLFFYAESLRHREHRVTINPPLGWNVTVALDKLGQEYVAANYDELVDSPFEVGPHSPLSFSVRGVEHQVVLWGEPRLDPHKLTADLSALVETEAALFGGLPLKKYVFFIYGTDKGRGGLEHKTSTALLFPRAGFSSPKGWEDFLTLCAHEYFHLWNIKRIQPRAFMPFDYGKENYTQLLWWFEGATSYYDNLLTRRAGLMSPNRFLTRLGESLSLLQSTPGRHVLPLTEASMLAWTKHYRPDENSGNSAISYYLKGEIVCALLDLTIRQASDNRRSLDDVLRLLSSRAADGVAENGVELAASEVAQMNLTAFFDRALRGTQELDLSLFSHVGLEARFRTRESTSDKGGTPPRNKPEKAMGYLGITAKGAVVATVADGSPAMEAGIYADDEIVALDGLKCDAGQLLSRCEEKAPGDTLRLTLFRAERLLELSVALRARPLDAVWLAKVDKPTDAQKAAYESWLGAGWDVGGSEGASSEAAVRQ